MTASLPGAGLDRETPEDLLSMIATAGEWLRGLENDGALAGQWNPELRGVPGAAEIAIEQVEWIAADLRHQLGLALEAQASAPGGAGNGE